MRFYGHLLVPSSACSCTKKTVSVLQRRGFASRNCFPSALCHLFYSHPRKVQSRFRALLCRASRGRLKSQTLPKLMEKVSPSLGLYSGSSLGQADNKISPSPGSRMFVILHGLAAVHAVLASKRLQNGEFILSLY